MGAPQANQTVINNVTIRIGTVNGSGSQTANQILMRAIFEMGIPVGSKNLFPSNIEGEPTWFVIRASREGHIGYKKVPDVVVCANPDSVVEDVKGLRPGGLCIYDAPLKAETHREDILRFEVPLAALAAGIPDTDARIRRMLANMVYVGVIAELLQLDWAALETAVKKQFPGKAKPIALNLRAAQAGAEYARKNLTPQKFLRLERMQPPGAQLIIDGNTAAAMGCVMAGCTVLGWYPITPATGICEQFIALAQKYRHDPKTGKATYATVQAEDELAAAGIILGAGWGGARSMTSTSGPGLSLMAELVGLGYFAEIPTVIFDVQRAGPSTGLPTRTMQCDLLFTAFLSHGDTKHIMLLPGSMEECYEFAQRAFDVAERFQTPVFVMSDLDMGMNQWVCKRLEFPQNGIDRGKVLDAKDLDVLQKDGKAFARYHDIDYDGIPYRTLPGTDHPMASYFTRGTGHNKKAQYSEDPEVFKRTMGRLARKIERSSYVTPAPILTGGANTDIGIIAFGSTDMVMPEVLSLLKERGLDAEYLRVRAFPFHQMVRAFLCRKKRIYVIEQNRDGQLAALLMLDSDPSLAGKLIPVVRYDGQPVDAQSIAEEIAAQDPLGKK